jgi:hypothetical protein
MQFPVPRGLPREFANRGEGETPSGQPARCRRYVGQPLNDFPVTAAGRELQFSVPSFQFSTKRNGAALAWELRLCDRAKEYD